MKSSLYGAQGPSQTQAGACSPARTQLFHLPPSKTHLLSPTTCFHVTFNICKRLWGAFVPARCTGDPQWPLTPHGFLLGLKNVQVSGVHPTRLLLGEKKKSKKDFRICRRVITTVCWCFWVIYSAKMLTVCSFHGFHFSLKEMFYFLSFFLSFLMPPRCVSNVNHQV